MAAVHAAARGARGEDGHAAISAGCAGAAGGEPAAAAAAGEGEPAAAAAAAAAWHGAPSVVGWFAAAGRGRGASEEEAERRYGEGMAAHRLGGVEGLRTTHLLRGKAAGEMLGRTARKLMQAGPAPAAP
jgi:hypothetical protein